MSTLNDIYQEVILDHNKSPRNFKQLENATQHLEGYNPLCGDKLTIYLYVKNDIIEDISFLGSGCAISKASASIMTDKLKGKSKSEAEDIFQAAHDMLTGEMKNEDEILKLGNLAALSGISGFPMRIKCATLAWHTLHAVLGGNQQPVSTE